jgi:hypothetical protein
VVEVPRRLLRAAGSCSLVVANLGMQAAVRARGRLLSHVGNKVRGRLLPARVVGLLRVQARVEGG